MNRQFIRFLFAGGIAAAANYGTRFLFSQWMRFEWAIVLAYLVGMCTAFVLMRERVFGAGEKKLRPQIINFSLINLLAIVQTLLISLILAYWLFPAWGMTENREAWAHLAGVLIPVITSYYGHKYLTFR